MIEALYTAAPAWAIQHAAPLLVMVPLFLAPMLALVTTSWPSTRNGLPSTA